jgi:hypothetical protein
MAMIQKMRVAKSIKRYLRFVLYHDYQAESTCVASVWILTKRMKSDKVNQLPPTEKHLGML